MQDLDLSTAATVLVGPVLDSAGAVYAGMVIADFNLTKNGTTAAMSGNTITHVGNGFYTIALTSGNCDTLGRLSIHCNKSTYAMTNHRFMVRSVGYNRAVNSIASGTVGAASTITSIVSSACSPAGAIADQYRFKVITFAADTTTAALRGQSCEITASSNAAAPVFTVSALTTAAVSGDTFTIA